MDEFRKAVRIVEEARDTAALLHSTYIRIQLEQALEVLAKAEVEFLDNAIKVWADITDRIIT